MMSWVTRVIPTHSAKPVIPSAPPTTVADGTVAVSTPLTASAAVAAVAAADPGAAAPAARAGTRNVALLAAAPGRGPASMGNGDRMYLIARPSSPGVP